MTLPELALSVRQPWAWAIVHGGKRIENRSWQAVNHGLKQRGPICIHAARGMTQDEYWNAADFMERIDVICPEPHLLKRGGIIGTAEVIDVVRESDDPWFFGPRGIVLANVQPVDFIPAPGALGYFRWERGGDAAPLARWMTPSLRRASQHYQPELPIDGRQALEDERITK